MKKTYKAKIVLNALKQYPNASTMAIARILLKENPLDFTKLESVRTIVRTYRGELKARKPKTTDITEHIRTEQTKKNFMKRSFELPESDYDRGICKESVNKVLRNILKLKYEK